MEKVDDESTKLHSTPRFNVKPTRVLSLNVCQRWLSRTLYLIYCLADMMTIQLVAQYTLYKAAQGEIWASIFENESQSDICVNATNSVNDSQLTTQWQNVQDTATQAVMFSGVISLLPNVLMVLLLGVWSDVTQRRVLHMFFPMLGRFFFALFLLLDFYVNMDNFTLMYVGSLMSGVMGGTVTFLASTSAYISETSSLENRTKELSVFEICNSIAVATGTLLIGYWIQSSGYEGPFWFLLSVGTLGCIICLFLKEPYSDKDDKHKLLSMKHKLTDIFCFSWCNSELTIVLGSYFMALGTYMFVHAGQLRVTTLFLETSPLCFDNITIGWWLFFQGIVMTLGMFGLPFFCHRCLHDAWITYIGLLSRAVGSFCLIFATTQAITFFGKIKICYFNFLVVHCT